MRDKNGGLNQYEVLTASAWDSLIVAVTNKDEWSTVYHFTAASKASKSGYKLRSFSCNAGFVASETLRVALKQVHVRYVEFRKL